MTFDPPYVLTTCVKRNSPNSTHRRVSRIHAMTLQYKLRVCGIGKVSCTRSDEILMETSAGGGAGDIVTFDRHKRKDDKVTDPLLRAKIERITVGTRALCAIAQFFVGVDRESAGAFFHSIIASNSLSPDCKYYL